VTVSAPGSGAHPVIEMSASTWRRAARLHASPELFTVGHTATTEETPMHTTADVRVFDDVHGLAPSVSATRYAATVRATLRNHVRSASRP